MLATAAFEHFTVELVLPRAPELAEKNLEIELCAVLALGMRAQIRRGIRRTIAYAEHRLSVPAARVRAIVPRRSPEEYDGEVRSQFRSRATRQ